MAIVLKLLFLSIAAAASLVAAGPFAWTQLDGGRYQLTEGGRPVFVYNAGTQLANGAPADRERCCYVYPAFTPSGVNPLDDFPKDHWHHHGLFWAWPVVEYDGKHYDLWMYRGVRHVAGSVDETSASLREARIAATNYWVAGDRKIVRERIAISATPASGSSRELAVTLTFDALDKPVTLRGSQENGKSYGGFNARFAPRESTVIRTDKGTLAKDDDLTHYSWAELEATYQGKRASLRITPDPANPGAPHQWCLRHYGFVGAAFPGRTADADGYTLEPRKPLTLRFRVTLTGAP